MAKKITKYQSKSIVKPNITAVKDNTKVKLGTLPIKPQPQLTKHPRMKKVVKKQPMKI